MVGGFERYFQIARCFRDEDQRADRQPDFTQLDIEMSFVDAEDVIDLNERLLAAVLAVGGVEVELPMKRLPYDEAIALRHRQARPAVRPGAGRDHGRVPRQRIQGLQGGDRRWSLGPRAQRRQAGVLALTSMASYRTRRSWGEGPRLGRRRGRGWRSPVAKFLSEAEIGAANDALGAEEGDVLLLVADAPATSAAVLGELRRRLGSVGADRPRRQRARLDRRLAAARLERGRGPLGSLQPPVHLPAGDFDPDDPGGARARAYDVVWNGWEIGGGSIRISDPDVQRRVFSAIGISDARRRSGSVSCSTLRYGAPPHGGIAYGLDRIVALLHGADSIRDVIAFPKTASGSDPLTARRRRWTTASCVSSGCRHGASLAARG